MNRRSNLMPSPLPAILFAVRPAEIRFEVRPVKIRKPSFLMLRSTSVRRRELKLMCVCPPACFRFRAFCSHSIKILAIPQTLPDTTAKIVRSMFLSSLMAKPNPGNAERAESCDPALSAMIRGKMMSDFEISVAERLPQP